MRMRSDRPSANRASTAPRSSSPPSSTAAGTASTGFVRRTRPACSGWVWTTSISCWCTGRTRTKIATSAAVQGLQAILDDGGLRAIGTSNFKPAHLQRVLEESGISPDVNQIQLSPYSTRSANREYHTAHDIVTESWSPLGASSDSLRNDPLITSIAHDHGKSSTQVVLRWHVQLGLVVIPRSSNPGRMAENIDIFDFELAEEEMSKISSLDRGESVVTDSDEFGH